MHNICKVFKPMCKILLFPLKLIVFSSLVLYIVSSEIRENP